MEIVEVDPFDEKALRAWHDTYYAAETFERPYATPWMFEEVRANSQASPVSYERILLGGAVDGELVSVAVCDLPLKDNLNRGEHQVYTAPGHRRRGHGTELLHHVETTLVARGRTVLVSMSDFAYEAGPEGRGQPGVSFLRHHGYDIALSDIQRTVALPIPDELLTRLSAEAEPHHSAYRVLSFVDRCPEELVDSFAELLGSLITEAPSGELVVEDEVFDRDRVRQDEDVMLASGRRRVVTVALDSSASVVGYTEVRVPSHHPGRAYQWGTLVRPAHRGHRLGVALKAANHAVLQREHPELTEVITYNADVNDHMIAVNELLGFRPTARMAELQKTL